jgi:hypothetical protein
MPFSSWGITLVVLSVLNRFMVWHLPYLDLVTVVVASKKR